MVIYRFNSYLKRYFCIDSAAYDPDEPTFDETIHDNAVTPIVYHRTVCGYCNTMYPSRNQLFHHLGFMGIDTRPPCVVVNDVCFYNAIETDAAEFADDEGDGEHIELGDFGLIRNKRKLQRMLKRSRKVQEAKRGWRLTFKPTIRKNAKRKNVNVRYAADHMADLITGLNIRT